MHSIEHSVSPKAGPDSIRFQFSGDFRVIWPTELPKFIDCVVLAHLEGDCWSRGQLIDQFFLFWEELIGLIELLGGGVVKPDHLHGADFEPTAQNGIDYLSDQLGLHRVRLDYAESAVLVVGTRFDHCLTRKDEADLSLGRSGSVTAVTCVLGAVLPVEGT